MYRFTAVWLEIKVQGPDTTKGVRKAAYSLGPP